MRLPKLALDLGSLEVFLDVATAIIRLVSDLLQLLFGVDSINDIGS